MKTIVNRLGWFSLIIPVILFGVITHTFGEFVISRPVNGWLQLLGTAIWLLGSLYTGVLTADIVKHVNSKNK
jgi:hypothetical protein